MEISLKEKIKARLLLQYDTLFSKKDVIKEDDLKPAIEKIFNDIISKENIKVPGDEREVIMKELIDECIGLGPLDPLLKDPLITEIMVNGPKRIYIEKNGKTELTDLAFDDNRHLMFIIHRMLMPAHRRLDEFMPFTDFCLPDGSRVNVILSPVSLVGSVVTIRKFLKDIREIEDLISLHTLDRRMGDLLVAAVKAKINIMFSGATGSGKTTTLSVLSSYISDDERIITIEDTPEIRLNQEHVISLQTRPPSIEGKGEISIRELFKNSLRMRPDRIILGEIRSGEALDMLQAMCSGHTGSLAVIHANSPQEVIYRLETMILTSGVPISMEGIQRQISAAVQLIVQQEQLLDGSRKITRITQIRGLKDGQIILEDLYSYEIESVDSKGVIKGRWKASGVTPVFYPILVKAGIELPRNIFNKD